MGKIKKIESLYLLNTPIVKSIVEISQNFVAFTEYNFNDYVYCLWSNGQCDVAFNFA